MMTKTCLMVLVAVLGCSTVLFAQEQSRGRVVSSSAVLWRTDAAVATSTVQAGTLLTITAASQNWYEVIIPDRQGNERALIARSQVQLLPGTPVPPARALRGDPAPQQPQLGTAGQRSQPAPQPLPRASVPPAFPRVFLATNGVYQVTSNDFDRSFSFQQNAEDAHVQTHHLVDATPGFSVAGGGMFSPHVGAGIAMSRLSQHTSTALSAEIPHPFFFNAPRAISGEVAGLEREELAFHGQARMVATPSGRMVLSVFGGPSWFRVKQSIVGNVIYHESYPYDQATFESIQVLDAETSALGFNVGGDAAYFLTARVGIGIGVMFSRATMDLPSGADNETTPIRAGGTGVSAGVRFRF
jgi:opacity protein-like surface antigen